VYCCTHTKKELGISSVLHYRLPVENKDLWDFISIYCHCIVLLRKYVQFFCFFREKYSKRFIALLLHVTSKSHKWKWKPEHYTENGTNNQRMSPIIVMNSVWCYKDGVLLHWVFCYKCKAKIGWPFVGIKKSISAIVFCYYIFLINFCRSNEP
jgi:hypothetical protein